MNVSWPLIDKHLGEESTAKVAVFQKLAASNPCRDEIQDLLARIPDALFPRCSPDEDQLPLAERCWRATQRYDYRLVYAPALENPRPGVLRLEKYAQQLATYQPAIDRLRRLEQKVQQFAPYSKDIACVTVAKAWKTIGFSGWRVMMPSLGLRRIVQHDVSALVNGPYHRSLCAFLAMDNQEVVIVYNANSEDERIQQLILEHQKCVIDVAHVQLRLARTYRLWIALQLWNQSISEEE